MAPIVAAFEVEQSNEAAAKRPVSAIRKLGATFLAAVATVAVASQAWPSVQQVLAASGELSGEPIVAKALEDPLLHCCATFNNRPLLLACDAATDDVITDITHATYGEKPSERIVCGDETLPACTSDVKDEVKALCVGKKSCSVDATMLGEGCAGKQPDETVVAVRWVCTHDHTPMQGDTPLPAVPLKADGGLIVDANGKRVRLKGVNWSGGQNWKKVPEGLNSAPLRDIARHIRELGFNYVRLPFSTEIVLSPDEKVPPHSVAANPQMLDMTGLEVYDLVVDALGHEGIMVMIDNHMHDADWCCNNNDCNGLWFSPTYSLADWVGMWATMAERYKDHPAVVGASVKNEPRLVCPTETCNTSFAGVTLEPDQCLEAQWATGPEALQYRLAVNAAGQAILDKAPHLLISICGIDYGQYLQYVGTSPPDLPKENVVYESHEYSWFHSREILEDAPAHRAKLNAGWGDIIATGVAPVIVSEFGFAHRNEDTPDHVLWWKRAKEYLQETGPLAAEGGLDWAYWQLSGVQEGGTGRDEGEVETFGVMSECWTGPFREVGHFDQIRDVMAAPVLPPAPGNPLMWQIAAGVGVVVVLIAAALYFSAASGNSNQDTELTAELDS